MFLYNRNLRMWRIGDATMHYQDPWVAVLPISTITGSPSTWWHCSSRIYCVHCIEHWKFDSNAHFSSREEAVQGWVCFPGLKTDVQRKGSMEVTLSLRLEVNYMQTGLIQWAYWGDFHATIEWCTHERLLNAVCRVLTIECRGNAACAKDMYVLSIASL